MADTPLGGLTGNALAVVILGILVAVGLLVLTTTQSLVENQTSNTSTAYVAVGQFITGLGSFGSWIGILVLVIIAGAIIWYLAGGGWGSGRS